MNYVLDWIFLCLVLQTAECARPIAVDIEKITGNPVTRGFFNNKLVPKVTPLIRRRRRHLNENDVYSEDNPYNPNAWHYDDNGELFRYEYVPEHFENDDYQPFLTPDKREPRSKKASVDHGHSVFRSQLGPILESMILETGIKQGPPFHHRVHKADLWAWGENPDLLY